MVSATPLAGGALVIDATDWAALGEHLREREAQRDQVVKQSRDASRLCKLALFALHKGDAGQAGRHLAEAQALLEGAAPLAAEPALRHSVFSGAVEEHATAAVFRAYVEENRLLKSTELPLCQTEEYLSAVLDFTQELGRLAIARATQRDLPAVAHCRDTADAIQGQLLGFDFRNSGLRRKFDGIKYTVKKLEDTMYQLSLAEQLSQQQAGGS